MADNSLDQPIIVPNSPVFEDTRLSVSNAVNRNADFEADLLKVSQATGVPLDSVRSHPEITKQRQRFDAMDLDKLEAQFPTTYKFLANQQNADVAHDDTGPMGRVESAFNSFKRGIEKGSIQDELGELNYKALTGTISTVEQARREKLKGDMGYVERQQKSVEGSAIDYFTHQTGYTGRQVVSSMREGLKGAAVGASAGAITATIAGQLGPQVALPEEIVTVPGMAALGGRAGFISSSALYNYKMESGFAFDEFSELRDEANQPLSRDVVQGAAIAVGLVNAGLETVGELAMLKLFPGADKLLAAGPKEMVKAMLAKPTVRQALAGAGKKWVQAASVEGFTEAIQELSTIFGREFAQGISGQEFKPNDLGEDAKRVGQAGMDAFVGSMGVGIPATGYRGYRDVREAQRMEQNQQFIQALGQDATESKLQTRLPEKFKEFVARVKEGGAIDNIYIPAEQFQTFFQGKGVDPTEVAAQVGATNYTEALAAGTDVVIPIENYASTLAATPLHQELSQDIRLRQDDMTAREYAEYQANKEAELKGIEENLAQLAAENGQQDYRSALQGIVTDIEGQLVAAGTERSTAAAQAESMRPFATMIYRDMLGRAERDGVQLTEQEVHDTIMRLWAQYGLNVSRPMPDILTRNFQSDISLDPLIDMLRTGVGVPSVEQMRGESLIPFIRKIGGIKPGYGELKDVDVGAKRKEDYVVRETGRALDEIGALAAEAGYFQPDETGTVSETTLLNAIAEELSGIPTYSIQNENQPAVQLSAALEQLDQYLSSLGIDIKAITDNAAVRKMIDQAMSDPNVQEAVQQFFQTIQTQAFQRWFGDSKVVDENGNPLVVYHASTENIEEFKPKGYGTAGEHSYFYFAASQAWSKKFAKEELHVDKPAMHAVYLSIQNPMDLRGKYLKPQEWIDFFDGLGIEMSDTLRQKLNDAPAGRHIATWQLTRYDTPENGALRESMIAAGYDGMILSDVVRGNMDNTTYVAFAPEQIKSATGNAGTFDPNNPNILYQSEQPGFEKWTHGHPVIELGESHEFKADEGVVVQVVHGTTGDFDTFDRSKANVESDLGGGFYFTNNVDDVGENYAGLGPDLTNKIERLAEQIAGETDREYNDPEVVAEAKARFMANQGTTMPVFVRFDNPAVIGGSQPTWLDFNDGYDADTDEYGEESGRVLELTEALREIESEGEFMDFDAQKAIDAIFSEHFDGENITAEDVINNLKGSEGIMYAMDSEGNMAGNEIIRQAFERIGYDGFIDQTVNQKFGSEKRVGNQMAGMDEDTVHFIAFKPTQIKSSIGNSGEFSETDPNILRQGDMSDKQGYIQFGSDRKFSIALLEKANLSTFLHETGHFWLEVVGDLATNEGASDQIKADYATLLNWFGVESRDQITTEHHEMFARANEAYLMSGEAPSAELRGVFQRFKSWLQLIYKQLTALNVELTPEVRGVFDRMYATDAEIEQAKQDVDMAPLFLTAADAKMTEAEFALYRAGVAEATASAKDALQAKLMREYQREQKQWWKEATAKMREEVAAEVDERPVYKAFAALVAGDIDGMPIKLNKDALVERYGAEYVKRLPRKFARIYTTKGGMDADAAATYLGFESGDSLVEALVSMRPRTELINAEADVRMRQTYGDMMTDGTLADEARVALHNEQRERVLMTELRSLRRKQAEVQPFVQFERDKAKADRRNARAAAQVPPAKVFRDAARGLIGQTAVRNIQPYRYLQAERRAARAAFEAMAKGDYMLAADAKQKELLNHYLYLEASQAKEDADATLKYMRRFESGTTREQMGKAGGDYLDQIDALLDRYEFRRVPLRALDRRKSLALWAAEQEALGNEVAVDPVLLDEARRVNYREVPVDELRAVRDAVKNIEHLARLKNKLVTKGMQAEFQDAVAELVASAENNGTRKALPLDMSAMTMSDRAGDTVSRLDAMLLKMEQIVEWLDGGNVTGPWHTYLWNPIAAAQVAENDLTVELTAKMVEALEAMPKEQRQSMLDTFEIPGMGKVTRKFIVSIGMNMGNSQNIDKMMRGFGWDMGVIEGALAKLNAQDIAYIQQTLDTIGGLWPQIAELEQRMTGLEPPRVETAKFDVKDEQGNVIGTIEGYFPLVYDPRKSEQGAKQETGNLGQLFEEGYVRATTPKGHTKARTEGFAAPLLLDFEQVVTQHLAKVVKDLTHREAIVAANKILTNPEIRNVLQETLGTPYEKQMLPWLRSVVNDRNGGSTQGLTDFSRWMMTARANVVAATMGFKATTAIMQITGLSQSLDMVKPKYLGQALLEFLRHPIALTNQVRSLSGEMRHRSNMLDRDIRDQLRNLTGQNSTWAQAQKFAFHGIALADAMVSVPTWMGAYRQALDAGATDEAARLEGDRAVRLTQGAGGQKDLAAVSRNNELAKTMTMFYSYFSALYNRMRDMGHEVQDIRDMPRFLARSVFTVMIPAVMGDIIVGRGPSGDDDEDKALWLIRKVLLYPLMSVPLLRDIAGSLDSGFDYKFSPIAAGFEKLAKTMTALPKLVEGDMEWPEFALKAADTIGYVFGVAGTSQLTATGKYLWRVNEGEESPDNLAELIFYAAVGKRKE